MDKQPQYIYVIDIMKKNGGFATLGFLNQNVDTSEWKTKTPFATIRRIVQDDRFFFKIKPGLWALNACKKEVLEKFNIDRPTKNKDEAFNHTYYQGLIVEMGNLTGYDTYVPNQDKNKIFLNKPLSAISKLSSIYSFSYPEVVNKAKTVDVVWFNKRKLPKSFFEVEHSTDFNNSLLKYFSLQDFNSTFYIISSEKRRREFEGKFTNTAYDEIRDRVSFVNYEALSEQHSKAFAFYKTKEGISLF